LKLIQGGKHDERQRILFYSTGGMPSMNNREKAGIDNVACGVQVTSNWTIALLRDRRAQDEETGTR